MNTWRFPASDLTFGWDECRRCFYLKHVYGCARPRAPFPKVFNVIDGLMKAHYHGQRTEDALPFLPPGTVRFADNWLQSRPLTIRDSIVTLTGRLDCVVAFDDGNNAILDYKTAVVKDVHLPFYGRQLMSYTACTEQAAPGRFQLGRVTHLGLVVVEHTGLVMNESLNFVADLSWLPIERDDAAFEAFLEEVVATLEQDSPPPAGPKCAYCAYRDTARRISA